MKFSRRALAAAGTAVAAVALTLSAVTAANAATLFTDDFNDGNADGWSKSGGSWSIATDGTGVYRQSSTGSDAKAQAGASSWTDYAVQARVKPLAFASGSGRQVAVLARAQNMTNYYFLALTNGGQVQLGRRVAGATTILGTASVSVSTGTWYTLRLDAFGSALRGYVDGTQLVSASDATFAVGKIGLGTLYASASFDDVQVTTDGSPSPTTPPVTTTPVTTPPVTSPPATTPPVTTSPPVPPVDGLVGWATVNGGTTGGAGGATVTVTSGTALAEALEEDVPLTIRVQGMLSMPDEMNDVHSNKTILGVGASSGLDGAGLNISSGYNNIIIRNLNFRNWGDDAINVQNSAHHIWIDHNSFTNGFDGAVDIKRGSDFVTVSWNRVFNHQKSMLLGHDDDNGAQDIGHLRVTYHHNSFEGSAERHPRVRFGNPVHVFNNYYVNNAYGVASTCDAGVLVEGNYFQNVQLPTAVGYAESPPGNLIQRNNIFVGSGTPQSAGTVNPIPYQYTVDSPATVPATVSANAGTGKITV
jgi:pectate lyase